MFFSTFTPFTVRTRTRYICIYTRTRERVIATPPSHIPQGWVSNNILILLLLPSNLSLFSPLKEKGKRKKFFILGSVRYFLAVVTLLAHKNISAFEKYHYERDNKKRGLPINRDFSLLSTSPRELTDRASLI
jgi:hypothetical protein